MHENIKGGALTEISFYILLALYTPNHGYGIMQFIDKKTNGRLRPGAGTLYGALTSLTEKGWIAETGAGQLRKKEYTITALGKGIAEKELERLMELTTIASDIMGGN